MTDRERLLEILNVPIHPHLDVDPLEAVADYLLDNGVTFARDTNAPSWIPVTERLPVQGQEVIVYTGGVLKPCVMGYLFWNPEYDTWARVTHWMPLPEPPESK